MTNGRVVRTAAALFLMAFGFSLLSVCLFRILSFKASSTPFFVLYVGLGMPIGAFLAKRRMQAPMAALGTMMRAQIWFPFAFLLIPIAASFGPDAFTRAWVSESDYVTLGLWLQIGYLTLVTSPLFVVWGATEFIGYSVALETKGIRTTFYVLFVWALALALAVGYVAIPAIGWLRTVAIVPLTGLLGYRLLVPLLDGDHRLTRPRIFAPVAVALMAVLGFVGLVETPYMLASMSRGFFTVNGLLESFNRSPKDEGTPGGTLLTAFWGEHIHFSLIQSPNGKGFVGAYDGVYMWPSGEEPTQSNMNSLFSAVPKGGDVCIIGAGGGRQVKAALDYGAGRVVAVDLASEVLDVLSNEFAWTNGEAYLDPRVETYGMDGRSYISEVATEEDLFDLIVLPYTENVPSVLRAMFETGHRIHSVEAFETMATRLKPNGMLVVLKGLDRDHHVYGNYANSLIAAGLTTYGFTTPVEGTKPWLATVAPFVLIGSHQPVDREQAKSWFASSDFDFVDFQANPPPGEAIYNDSPWIHGMLGVLMQRRMLDAALLGAGLVALLSVILIVVLSMRRRVPEESRARNLLPTVAGVAIGINAVYLENALIFWLIDNLLNPLAAFFVGAASFLLVFGFASFVLRWWRIVAVAGVGGAVVALAFGHWSGGGMLVGLGLMVLAGGLCFPLLAVRFELRLLDLFIADAIGGLIGGLLGIWLPVLFGLQKYFVVLPWICVASLAIVAVAAVIGQRTTQVPAPTPGTESL